MRGFPSPDDLWSVVGYLFVVVLMRVMQGEIGLALASAVAAGMLAIFWLASDNVRARNAHPNVRIGAWALVAGVSFLLAGAE